MSKDPVKLAQQLETTAEILEDLIKEKASPDLITAMDAVLKLLTTQGVALIVDDLLNELERITDADRSAGETATPSDC